MDLAAGPRALEGSRCDAPTKALEALRLGLDEAAAMIAAPCHPDRSAEPFDRAVGWLNLDPWAIPSMATPCGDLQRLGAVADLAVYRAERRRAFISQGYNANWSHAAGAIPALPEPRCCS